jgi:hypothetical protein
MATAQVGGLRPGFRFFFLEPDRLEDGPYEGLALFWLDYFGAWGDGAVGGVEYDLFDHGFGFVAGGFAAG